MARKKTKEVTNTNETMTMTIAQLEAKAATEPYFGKGIALAGGFDLGAKSALDSRSTVKTIEERDAHVTGNRTYEGMLVYVEEDQKTYQFIDNGWKIFGFDVDQFEASVEDSLTSSSTVTALSANQGKILNEKITVQTQSLNETKETVAQIGTTVEGIQESVSNIDSRLTATEADLGTAKTNIASAQDSIASLEANLALETSRATQAETTLDEKIDQTMSTLSAADLALDNKIADAVLKINTANSGLETEIQNRTDADTVLDGKITANTQAIAQEVTDRRAEITRVENITTVNAGEIAKLKEADTALQGAITREEQARTLADQTINESITALTDRVAQTESELDSLELTWDRITSKPFETLGSTVKKSETGALDVKLDNTTIESKVDGTLQVKDGVFAAEGHNHDTAYATKAHEENKEIHLTSEEKVNVGKIPTIESEVTTLKSTVGAASQHHIVMTVVEMNALENTNHGDICHVIETKKTYILDKEDTDQDSIVEEWIELADFNSLVTVDWSIIQNKPFATVGEGLVVSGDIIKVLADDTTIEIKDGKISVKEDVFSTVDHTHEILWEDIQQKPNTFFRSYAASEWIDSEDGLVYLVVEHNRQSVQLHTQVVGSDNIERLVAVEYIDANSIKVWSDKKEIVTVSIFSHSLDLGSPSQAQTAIVGRAKVNEAIVGNR